jgi:hypothetical protein
MHRSTSILDAAMVLLKSVVEISARPMPHMFAELGPDGARIGVMSIGGDPIRSDAGHRLGRSKECPGSSKVTMLAEHDWHHVFRRSLVTASGTSKYLEQPTMAAQLVLDHLHHNTPNRAMWEEGKTARAARAAPKCRIHAPHPRCARLSNRPRSKASLCRGIQCASS